MTEARDALIAVIQKYPTGKHLEEAKDLLGETNVAILLSRYPSPEKTEYVVKSGDVLAKIAAEVEDDSRANHAHEQHERHHATHWRSSSHLHIQISRW